MGSSYGYKANNKGHIGVEEGYCVNDMYIVVVYISNNTNNILFGSSSMLCSICSLLLFFLEESI